MEGVSGRRLGPSSGPLGDSWRRLQHDAGEPKDHSKCPGRGRGRVQCFSGRISSVTPSALAGQKSNGRYPDQTNDLKLAVREARKYPGGNGKVGAIGGSAGGSHDVYLAATGTKGDDRLDAAVALSGVYDFTDKRSLGQQRFWRIVQNYVGSSSPEDLRKASPITYVDASVAPLYVIASDNDTMPPEQYSDLVRRLEEVGATNFKQRLRTNSQQHSFSCWPEVKDEVLDFLREHLDKEAGLATASVTPTPIASATPSATAR